jgi:hypothetical protein
MGAVRDSEEDGGAVSWPSVLAFRSAASNVLLVLSGSCALSHSIYIRFLPKRKSHSTASRPNCQDG